MGQGWWLLRFIRIALDALVKEAKPDPVQAHQTNLPCLTSSRSSSSRVYLTTRQVLKDAIMKYQDPYGHVSQLDKVEFDRCECIDKNGPTHQPPEVCVAGRVHQEKVIYTQGEATRRVHRRDVPSPWGHARDRRDAIHATQFTTFVEGYCRPRPGGRQDRRATGKQRSGIMNNEQRAIDAKEMSDQNQEGEGSFGQS